MAITANFEIIKFNIGLPNIKSIDTIIQISINFHRLDCISLNVK
jgi:hypothetical protein